MCQFIIYVFSRGGVVIKRWYQLGESAFCKVDVLLNLKKVDQEEEDQFWPKNRWRQLRMVPWGQCSGPIKLQDSLICNNIIWTKCDIFSMQINIKFLQGGTTISSGCGQASLKGEISRTGFDGFFDFLLRWRPSPKLLKCFLF